MLILTLCALALIPPDPIRTPVASPAELIGEPRTHIVKRGESAYRIARQYGVGTVELMRANRLSSQTVKPGAQLVVPTVHIPPVSPFEGIVLNVPERAVYVFRNGAFVRRFAGAVGRPSGQTATGSYVLRSKVVNPTWRPPRSMVINEGVRDEPVPPGPRNPLGDRWMGWSKAGFGFHSTLAPRSIGRAASHGCVRLYPEGAREMFRVVTVGMPIHSVYRPVVLGKSDGVYYLSVFQDIYGRGGNSLKDIKKLLEAAGIGSLVDETRLRKVAAEQLCTPQRILGELESIEVDGKAVQTPVSPVMVSGIWMVPVQGVAEALGVVVEPLGDPFFRLRKDASTCELQSGNRIAALDGRNVQLAAAPAKLDGNLMVPLRVLLELTAATVEVDRGEAIRIRTAQMVPEPNPGAPQ